jgi:superfamily II DNA helicase RecQ/very-short-patch-repair endonuclease
MSKKKRLQAAYIFESVIDNIYQELGNNKMMQLLKNLSQFDLECSSKLETIENIDSKWLVLTNLISRGSPARMSYDLERRILVDMLNFDEKEKYGTFYFHPAERLPVSADELYNAFFIIEPRLKSHQVRIPYELSWEALDSIYEEEFLYYSVPEYVNDGEYLLQVIEAQKSFENIANRKSYPDRRFIEQRCDFVLHFPLEIREKRGIIIEIDGSQHNEARQRHLDTLRDQATIDNGWSNTLRIPTKEWDNMERYLQDLQNDILQDDYFQKLKKNFKNPIFDREFGEETFLLTLMPLEIARIQKLLTEAVICGVLKLTDETWNICIVERDIPGGAIALDDWKIHVEKLWQLSGNSSPLPKINLTVYQSPEFLDYRVNVKSSADFHTIENCNDDDMLYDLLIDSSILTRKPFYTALSLRRTPKLTFRSYSIIDEPEALPIESGKSVTYLHLAQRDAQDRYQIYEEQALILRYFLRWIFRKKDFREGQIPILNRIMQQKSVIGLLPTGGGKSLTYQLAALLQPGIALVIDPIKSLMKDQVDGLNRNWIDKAGYINSSLKQEEKQIKMAEMSRGLYQFMFISPERLVIESFREALKTCTQINGFGFSIGVIDEAHCVSEWGHDFRPVYLALGRHLKKYARNLLDESLPLMALTATASFDVLSDIQRELADDPTNQEELISEEAIVKFETTNRFELQYEIIPVEAELPENDYEAKKELGAAKQSRLQEYLKELPKKMTKLNESEDIVYFPLSMTEKLMSAQEVKAQIRIENDMSHNFLDKENQNAGIIFCPHRTWFFGVTDRYNGRGQAFGVADSLQGDENLRIVTFIGADMDDSETANRVNEDNNIHQDDFLQNKSNLMVCTKAFGMGIDKPNVRYSVHFNYPQSLESFVQESGRIGRDGKLALATIFFHDSKLNHIENPSIDYLINQRFYQSAFPGVEKEYNVIRELLTTIQMPKSVKVGTIFASIINFDKEFSDGYTVKYWEKKQAKILYLDCNNEQKIGSVDLNTMNISRPTDLSQSERHKLYFFKKLITKTKGTALFKQVKDFSGNSLPGIETLMNLGIYESYISFESDNEKIQNEIRELGEDLTGFKIDNQWNFEKILTQIKGLEELDFESDSYNYLKLHRVLLDLRIARSKIEKIEKLYDLFNRIRTEIDTGKAIYRFLLLGVIDDYCIDYNKKVYHIRFSPKDDKTYKDNLSTYLRRYHSESKTIELMSKIPDEDGDTMIQKIFSFLIKFLYKEIAMKRRKAIDAVREFCLVGLEEGQSNRAMKEFIDVYFNSKYAKAGYVFEYEGKELNGSLNDRTQEGREQKLEWVWEFIEIATEKDSSGASLVNLKHLRGCALRFLRTNPNNGTLLILKAFSTFILEEQRFEKSLLLQESYKELLDGFVLFYEELIYGEYDLYYSTVRFMDYIKKNIQLDFLLGEIQRVLTNFEFEYHRKWLKNFNDSFTGDNNG